MFAEFMEEFLAQPTDEKISPHSVFGLVSILSLFGGFGTVPCAPVF